LAEAPDKVGGAVTAGPVEKLSPNPSLREGLERSPRQSRGSRHRWSGGGAVIEPLTAWGACAARKSRL